MCASSATLLQLTTAEPLGAPAPWRLEPGAWELDERDARETVDVAVDSVEEVTPDVSSFPPVSGGVRVTVLGASPRVHCGEAVEVPLRLRLAEVYRDPGAWSYNDQLLGEGIGAIGSVKSGRLQVTAAGAPGCSPAACPRCRSGPAPGSPRFPPSPPAPTCPRYLRLDNDDAAMLAAMLFGDRARLRPSLRVGFERTGTFHLFVVSGLHVTLARRGRLRRPAQAPLLRSGSPFCSPWRSPPPTPCSPVGERPCSAPFS